VFAEIIAAAADYEQSNRTQLRWEGQFGYAAVPGAPYTETWRDRSALGY
jgi:hypothetical protein